MDFLGECTFLHALFRIVLQLLLICGVCESLDFRWVFDVVPDSLTFKAIPSIV